MTARVQIALRLPAELAAEVDARAAELGVSRHEAIVRLIRDGLHSRTGALRRQLGTVRRHLDAARAAIGDG